MKKNIAFIIPALYGGGAERVVSTLSKELSKDNNVYIIIYGDTESKYSYGGNLINIDSKESNNVFGKVLNTLYRIYKIKGIKKKYKINESISFLYNPNVINILTKVDDKVTISIRNHKSEEISSSKQKIQKFIMKFLYNKANEVISISEGVKEDLVNNFSLKENKIKVIYNPIDLEYINKMKLEKIESEYNDIFDKYTIITAGRLTKQKGQWHLIKAFKKINNKFPEVNLVILGKGEMEYELKKLVDDLGVKNIYFLGLKENPFKYMKNSDLFVFPSQFEGFGNVILEAMACDIPIISTDCKSGPKEILNPSNINKNVKQITKSDYGILIPVCQGEYLEDDLSLNEIEDMLVEAITKLIQNKELANYYKNKGKERLEDFKMENIAKKWI